MERSKLRREDGTADGIPGGTKKGVYYYFVVVLVYE
jgi:hypothetical protein